VQIQINTRSIVDDVAVLAFDEPMPGAAIASTEFGPCRDRSGVSRVCEVVGDSGRLPRIGLRPAGGSA
jgi:hypothetical protein